MQVRSHQLTRVSAPDSIEGADAQNKQQRNKEKELTRPDNKGVSGIVEKVVTGIENEIEAMFGELARGIDEEDVRDFAVSYQIETVAA